MKNKDKYKTAEEAYDAYCKFCNDRKSCKGCMCERKKVSCKMSWLYAEAEVEKNEEENLPGQMKMEEFIGD